MSRDKVPTDEPNMRELLDVRVYANGSLSNHAGLRVSQDNTGVPY